MQSSSLTIAMFRRYGRTIEKSVSSFIVNRLALLGASLVGHILADNIFLFLLSMVSISIYLNVSPLGVHDCIGANT